MPTFLARRPRPRRANRRKDNMSESAVVVKTAEDRAKRLAEFNLSEEQLRNAIIEGDKELRRRCPGMAGNFDLMYELAQVLNRKRAKRGSIDFDLPEPVIEFDEWGLMKSISPSERCHSTSRPRTT